TRRSPGSWGGHRGARREYRMGKRKPTGQCRPCRVGSMGVLPLPSMNAPKMGSRHACGQCEDPYGVQRAGRGCKSTNVVGLVRGALPLGGIPLRAQHDLHLWLFFDPSFSRRATVSRNGGILCTGPFAMSAVVWPFLLTAVTSAPFAARYSVH